MYAQFTYDRKCDVRANQDHIPSCPKLKEIHLASKSYSHIKLDQSLVTWLAKAQKEGKLPNLSHVILDHTDGKLDKLFEGQWDSVRHLSINRVDNSLISNPRECAEIFPQLTHLDADGCSMYFSLPGHSTLSHLRIRNKLYQKSEQSTKIGEDTAFPKLVDLEVVNISDVWSFLEWLEARKLSTLHRLSVHGHDSQLILEKFAINELFCLELNRVRFSENLSSLFQGTSGLPKMEKLRLVKCELTAHDMRCLVQACSDGWLPVLKHLDVSQNAGSGGSKYLFLFECKWNNLISLNIAKNNQQSYGGEVFDDFKHLTQKVMSGCLGSLEELTVSTEDPDYVPKSRTFGWQHLKSLTVFSRTLSREQLLSPIAQALEANVELGSAHSLLGSLQSLVICLPTGIVDDVAFEKQRLRRRGVKISFVAKEGYW